MPTPEEKVRAEMAICSLCQLCGPLLQSVCPVFPAMYKLMDEESRSAKKNDMKHLKEKVLDLCYLCGMCPCENVPQAITESKADYVARKGQSLQNRVLGNVEQVAKLGKSTAPLTNLLLKKPATRFLVEKVVGVDRRRKIPLYRKVSFEDWFRNRQKEKPKHLPKNRVKVAYYVGCSTNYYFPEVGIAVVEVLEKNDIEVFYPEQRCCGMPTLIDGSRKATEENVEFNVKSLVRVVDGGYDIVVSCPTCAVMLKTLMNDESYLNLPSPEEVKLISEHTYDVGEYLGNLHREGRLNIDFGEIRTRVAYFPPCHTKAQDIGTPFLGLMKLVPGLSVEHISGTYCCGLGGTFGFKRQYYDFSMEIGKELLNKIKMVNPDLVATDCNGCRIQINQATEFEVLHPVEILRTSYEKYLK